MKVIVNDETCIGCGLCEQTCPSVFRLEDGVAKAAADPVPAEADASC